MIIDPEQYGGIIESPLLSVMKLRFVVRPDECRRSSTSSDFNLINIPVFREKPQGLTSLPTGTPAIIFVGMV